MSSGQSSQHEYTQSSADPGLLGSDTYYSLLNVPYDATPTQIRRAYRQSMMRAHPDRVHPSRRESAENVAKLLNLAYATLSDPAKRKSYDESIKTQALQNEIMGKYVSGLGGSGMPAAHAPRRPMTERERQELRESNRSSMITLFTAFLFMTLAALVLLLIFTLATNGMKLVGSGWW